MFYKTILFYFIKIDLVSYSVYLFNRYFLNVSILRIRKIAITGQTKIKALGGFRNKTGSKNRAYKHIIANNIPKKA